MSRWSPGPHEQSGFNLIELMVAMTISLLMMAAILALFLDVSRTNDEMAKTNAQIESGRAAIQLIASDLAHGGFWDGYVSEFDDLSSAPCPSQTPCAASASALASIPAAVPAPCAAYSTWDPDPASAYKVELLGIPVQAYDSVPTGCSTVVTNKKAGTDILVTRHADTSVTNLAAFNPNVVYFQASSCSASVYDNWLTKKAAFVGFDWKKPNSAAAQPVGSCATTGLPADLRKYSSNIYWVRDYSVTPGDGIPTLMRAEFAGDGLGDGGSDWKVQPLIDGVENFSVELGVDNLSDSGAAVDYTTAINWAVHTVNNKQVNDTPTNRGDGVPDGFIRCTTASICTVNQLVNVVAVKVYVLVRNSVSSPGYTDSKVYCLGTVNPDGTCPSAKTFTPNAGERIFKRHLYSTTVRLQNIAMRRETP